MALPQELATKLAAAASRRKLFVLKNVPAVGLLTAADALDDAGIPVANCWRHLKYATAEQVAALRTRLTHHVKNLPCHPSHADQPGGTRRQTLFVTAHLVFVLKFFNLKVERYVSRLWYAFGDDPLPPTVSS